MNIYELNRSRNKSLTHLIGKGKTWNPRVTVTQCPLVTAIKLAKEKNITLQFCTACVHANIGGASATVKWVDVKNEDDAVILAVQDCIDKFNKLTGKH